ncbi:TPA_asm: UL20.6 uORF [Human alphaherpesvirus 1]|nr:TPA_asm: UL20.6 uORF [Human alphaherpesvirus 1]
MRSCSAVVPAASASRNSPLMASAKTGSSGRGTYRPWRCVYRPTSRTSAGKGDRRLSRWMI